VPTLSQLVRAGQESAAKIKRATKEALAEWFAQSERLNIARTHYKLRGERFADFASRIGIDRASAYQLMKLLKHRTAILARCRDEGRYYGWETCLYWFERDPRRSWHRSPHGSHTDEYGTPPSVFKRFGSGCTLDVCATTETAVCRDHFTKAHDGLKRPWHGTVWMNPPYSDLHTWCAKAYEYAQAGGMVIALLPAWTDAPWFHDFVSFGRITFIRGKLSFVGRKGYSWFPSMIVLWSPETVRRRPDAPLDVVLDTGVAVGGAYLSG
jgi:phage N-6-adenine-methyltransferase